MKLLVEKADFDQIEVDIITEKESGKKEYIVKGIFGQSEIVNKNKRFYKRELLERETNLFQNKITNRQSLGELNHSDSIDVSYERACQLINVLRMEKNNVYGEAKILDTPTGKCLIPLLDEKIKIGESSRALGTLTDDIGNEGYKLVNNDFKLITYDVVNNPSARDAYVALMENSEYILENGLIKEIKLNEFQKSIHTLKKEELKTGILNIFQKFINEVANGK